MLKFPVFKKWSFKEFQMIISNKNIRFSNLHKTKMEELPIRQLQVFQNRDSKADQSKVEYKVRFGRQSQE